MLPFIWIFYDFYLFPQVVWRYFEGTLPHYMQYSTWENLKPAFTRARRRFAMSERYFSSQAARSSKTSLTLCRTVATPSFKLVIWAIISLEIPRETDKVATTSLSSTTEAAILAACRDTKSLMQCGMPSEQYATLHVGLHDKVFYVRQKLEPAVTPNSRWARRTKLVTRSRFCFWRDGPASVLFPLPLEK